MASNAKVWRETAFILNHEESDGLFGHVARRPRPRARRTSTSRVGPSVPASGSRWRTCARVRCA
ncbi:hypothetical protein [Streptomyces sp. TLI_185]|uniref:hypothetical protein n=1 Tax=Streptomyces sp. TLI_185 TaxID=2485151 RepID=UPI000F4E7240